MDHSTMDPNYSYRTSEGQAVRSERQSLEESILQRKRTAAEEDRYQLLCKKEVEFEFPENA